MGIVVENTIQPVIVQNYLDGTPPPSENILFLLNHLGDVSNGFFGVLIPNLMLTLISSTVDLKKENQKVQRLLNKLQILTMLAIGIWIVDAETTRILPLSELSTPDILDIPMGIFGIITAALTTQRFQEHINTHAKHAQSNKI